MNDIEFVGGPDDGRSAEVRAGDAVGHTRVEFQAGDWRLYRYERSAALDRVVLRYLGLAPV